ncbi:hypothetical protein BH09PSE5_BH09PSE5_46880 [soil metagenome]
MDIQTLIVTFIVVPSVAYASWAVMPTALRTVIAKAMLRVPSWPAGIDGWLRKTAAGNSGCGCSGCDNNPANPVGSGKPKASAEAPVHIVRVHPRAKR